jgi:hypothetical protein
MRLRAIELTSVDFLIRHPHRHHQRPVELAKAGSEVLMASRWRHGGAGSGVLSRLRLNRPSARPMRSIVSVTEAAEHCADCGTEEEARRPCPAE